MSYLCRAPPPRLLCVTPMWEPALPSAKVTHSSAQMMTLEKFFCLELTLTIQDGLEVLCNAVFLWWRSDSWRLRSMREDAGMEPVLMACLWILVLQWGWLSLCFPYLYPKLPVLGMQSRWSPSLCWYSLKPKRFGHGQESSALLCSTFGSASSRWTCHTGTEQRYK